MLRCCYWETSGLASICQRSMQLVGAFACSHAGFLITHYDKAAPEKRDQVYQGFAEDVSIDHSFVTPLMLITPDLDVPIVPIVQNCRMPPMPKLARSHAVGHLIGAAIRSSRTPGDVVVIGT